MRMARVRFTIGRLMIVVAVAGLFAAWLRVPDAGAWTAIALVTCGPASYASWLVATARPGRRLVVTTWIACLWPLSIPCLINLGRLVDRGFSATFPALGGHVRIDLPALGGYVTIDQILLLPLLLFFVLSMFSTVVCLCLLITATRPPIEIPWADRAVPGLLMPVVWFFVVVILIWDPFGAAKWLIN